MATPKPVFVFPGSIDFYLEDQTTHKKIITIYNPYDQDITFKGKVPLLRLNQLFIFEKTRILLGLGNAFSDISSKRIRRNES